MQRLLKTLVDHVATYLGLVGLGVICLSWSVIALICYPLLPTRTGTALGRFGIMVGFRLYAWTLSATGSDPLDLLAMEARRGGPPVVLMPKNPSRSARLL